MKELDSYHDLLAAGDRVYDDDGGVITKAAPGGIAAIGIAVLVQCVCQHATQRGPTTTAGYLGCLCQETRREHRGDCNYRSSNQDLNTELSQAETEDKNAQVDYETMMKESVVEASHACRAEQIRVIPRRIKQASPCLLVRFRMASHSTIRL